jgi:putative ABC transport system ATP-binding protein
MTATTRPPSSSRHNGHEPPSVVRLRGLTKTYEEGGLTRHVLHSVDVDISEGEFVVLLGKSGSGKSTLLNLIGGIDIASGGEVWVRNTCLTTLKEPALTLFRRDHIGFIFQFFNLIPTLTAGENVSLSYELRGHARRESEAAATQVLGRVGLANRANTYPDKLSGGEQQRVAIARALIHQPDLILADEPTGNLDEDTGASVLRLLLELSRDAGKTLIMATHNPEVVPFADVVYHIHEGKLVADDKRIAERL